MDDLIRAGGKQEKLIANHILYNGDDKLMKSSLYFNLGANFIDRLKVSFYLTNIKVTL